MQIALHMGSGGGADLETRAVFGWYFPVVPHAAAQVYYDRLERMTIPNGRRVISSNDCPTAGYS